MRDLEDRGLPDTPGGVTGSSAAQGGEQEDAPGRAPGTLHSPLDYRLAILTHGRADTLARTVASFAKNVTPAPSDVVIHSDGGNPGGVIHSVARAHPEWSWTLSESFLQRGFCQATRELWREASARGTDYVFWLEHDFEIARHVDLTQLAAVVDAEPRVAQMALMRDASNSDERRAGGLYEHRLDQYTQRRGDVDREHRPPALVHWLDHASYFTTNPSLMTRAFMADNPWPAYADDCEGLFSIDLSARGYRYGAWGEGEPWCHHIGQRDGSGYGY